MAYFPFYIDISQKSCVVVGGGRVALRKIEKLLPFGVDITVVARNICDEIKALNIKIIEREFHDNDIDHAFMVISATDDRELNRRIFRSCTAKNILINSVDDIESCGFVFPALIKSGAITIGITTSGKAPAYSRKLKKRIQAIIDDTAAAEVEEIARYRESIQAKLPDVRQRKDAVERYMYEIENRHAREQAGSDPDGACDKSTES